MRSNLTRDLVSVIIPTYNSEKYIEDTLKSVINQTYINWEVILVDDCSKDSTVKIVKKFSENNNRFKLYINEFNQGAAYTRNLALRNSNGQYIAFLDADDVWYERKLEKQIQFMREKNVSFCFTPYEIIDENNFSIGKIVDKNAPRIVSYKDMLAKKATMGCSTVIIDNSIINELEMPLIRTGQDYGLWLKILRDGVHAQRISDVLTKYRITPNSISRNKLKKAMRQWQIYRSFEHIKVVPSLWYFTNYTFRAIFRA